MTSPEYEAARNAASHAAEKEGLTGMVTAVVVAYRLVSEDGEDHAGWLYDGSRVEAVGLLELAKSEIIFEEDE